MKEFLHRAFTENAALKAVAFILAVTLFILVRGDKETERNIPVSVAYVKPGGQTLLQDVPGTVEVRVRGPWTRIKRLDASDVDPILIDLTRVSEGELPIAEDLVHLPPGLRVASIKPARITVAYVHEKELLIVPQWSGTPADGFRLEHRGDDPDHPLTTPSRLEVRGPKAVLDGLTNVKTLPISLDDRKAGFHARVGLVPLPEGAMPDVELQDVGVDVSIVEELAKRVVAAVPVQVRLPAGATYGKLGEPTVQPATVEIVLSGSRVTLAKVVEREVKAVVELHHEDLVVVRPRQARVLVEGTRPGVQSEVNPPEVLLVPSAAPTSRTEGAHNK